MTRWPNKETVGDWSQGVPLEKMKALADYWRTTYDMRRLEQRLNAVPQFRTQIDGLGIHFLHVKSKHSNALPIIMTHGWPGSVVEFLKVLRPADRSDGARRQGRRRVPRGRPVAPGLRLLRQAHCPAAGAFRILPRRGQSS
jgi:hypothetical protein